MNLSLYQMTTEYEKTFLELADLDIPEEAINDTIEALEGELMLKGANVAAFALNLEAEAEKIKEAEKRIAARRKTFENKAKRIREYLRENMERAGIQNISAIDGSFSVTLTKPRASVIITDEESLKPDFVVIKTAPDKKAIGDALKEGLTVDGAELQYKSGLRIA